MDWAIPLIEFLQAALDCMSIILSCQPLQEKEGLLEHAQQILLKIHWHTVLWHKLIDTGHGKNTKPGTIHLVALTLLSISPSSVWCWWHCPRIKLPIWRWGIGGDEGSNLGLCPKITAKTCKMENGCQQCGCDACGKWDPAEQVSQTLQNKTTELMTLIVQCCHGLAKQLWVLAALKQIPQQFHWHIERTKNSLVNTEQQTTW